MFGPQEIDQCDMVLETICALQRLEDTYYYKEFETITYLEQDSGIDPSFRNDMAQWYFEIARHYAYQHETIAVAISCLDRFLAIHPEILEDPTVAGLAGMTALYTSVKFQERRPLKLDKLVALSDDQCTKKDFEDMETFLLNALEWRLNPPTAMEFVRHLLLAKNGIISSRLIPDAADREVVLEVAETQIELALCDDAFTTVKSSYIAFGALMNAFKTALPKETNYHENLEDLRKILLVTLDLDMSVDQLSEIQDRLYLLVVGMMNQLIAEEEEKKEEHEVDETYLSTTTLNAVTEESPRSVVNKKPMSRTSSDASDSNSKLDLSTSSSDIRAITT